MIKDLDQMAIDTYLKDISRETEKERLAQNIPASNKDKGLLHNLLKAFGLCLLIMGQYHDKQH